VTRLALQLCHSVARIDLAVVFYKEDGCLRFGKGAPLLQYVWQRTSLDDLVIASFTTGPGSSTLPIRIYSEVRLGVKPEINAICTLVIGLIAVVIVAASLVSKLTSSRGESAAPR
jgi:hypothetical protein